MQKVVFFLLTSIMLTAWLAGEAADNPNISAKRNDSSDYNFVHYEATLAKPRRDLLELYRFPGWFKPVCDQPSVHGRSRLVLKVTTAGKAIVNPPHEELGWSSGNVELRGLRLADAEKLWGNGRGGENNVKTFDLLTSGEPEKDVYHLDIEFANGVLASYRIRGSGISNPEWVTPK